MKRDNPYPPGSADYLQVELLQQWDAENQQPKAKPKRRAWRRVDRDMNERIADAVARDTR